MAGSKIIVKLIADIAEKDSEFIDEWEKRVLTIYGCAEHLYRTGTQTPEFRLLKKFLRSKQNLVENDIRQLVQAGPKTIHREKTITRSFFRRARNLRAKADREARQIWLRITKATMPS